MKRFFLFSTLAVMAALCFSSCEEEITTVSAVTINVTMPSDFPATAKYAGDVTLVDRNSDRSYSATAVDGVAVIPEVPFGVYDAVIAHTMDHDALLSIAPDVAAGVSGAIGLNGNLAKIELIDETSVAQPFAISLTWRVPSVLVFSKVYEFGTRNIADKIYNIDKYWEIYNNSTEPQSLDEVYLGEVYGGIGGTAETQYMSLHPDAIFPQTVISFPAGTVINPGESIVVAQNGKNHVNAEVITQTVDLSSANFECYVEGSTSFFPTDNADVPNMIQQSAAYSGQYTSKFGVAQGAALVMFKMTAAEFAAASEQSAKIMVPENESYVGTSFEAYINYCMKVPANNVLDAVDTYNSSLAENRRAKRVQYVFDASQVGVPMSGGAIAERKVLYTTLDGHKVLTDTNNSANDFVVTLPSVTGNGDHLTPRDYDKPVLN